MSLPSVRYAAPALIALFAAAPMLPAQKPAPVEIVLANFSFTPEALRLSGGTPVTLHFVNQGSGSHDFTAPAFFKAARMEAATRAALKDGKVSLDKGESRDVTLTPARGHYPVHCSHFLHTSFGMKGSIDVE